jgi:hypothetical protein
MAQPNHTQLLAQTEEALTILYCLVHDACSLLNPNGRRYELPKRLSDSEIIAITLLQQLWGLESERSFLRDIQRFFSHLFPGVVGSILPRCTAGCASSGAYNGASAPRACSDRSASRSILLLRPPHPHSERLLGGARELGRGHPAC